jgi:Grx4 family monothiol glutaredoxin
MANVFNIKTSEEFSSLLDKNSSLVVVHFWMPWSQPSVQMSEVLDELAQEHEQAIFVKIEAENFPDICMKYKIAAVPTSVFIRSGKVVDRVDGAHAPELGKKTAKYCRVTDMPPMPPPPKEDLNSRLKRLLSSAPCLLFMKGTPEEPKCGFSKQMVALLKEANIQFSTFDILTDEEVRQGLKTYSNWPTYPQLYANGELLGGLDIVKELIASNELQEMVPKQRSIEERFV